MRGLGAIAARSAALSSAKGADPGLLAVPTAPSPAQVSGAIITHSPASSGLYIGSPAITILTNGDYLAAPHYFGPNLKEHQRASTEVFRSTDRGNTWRKAAEIPGAFWSSLFAHHGELCLIGLNRNPGHINGCRSTDGGTIWTSPTNSRTSALRADVRYHTAPMPVVEHQGRLWRAFEDAMGETNWRERYRAGMLSVPVDAVLLDAANWTSSNFLSSDCSWNGGDMGGWLEGNAVITCEGRVVNSLRLETRDCPEKVAVVNISPDGKIASFDPARGCIWQDVPAGCRSDARAGRYHRHFAGRGWQHGSPRRCCRCKSRGHPSAALLSGRRAQTV